VRGLAEKTHLTPEEAQRVAGDVEQGLGRGVEAMGSAQNALNSAGDAGNVILVVAGALALGLVCAVLGASIGVSRRQRRAATLTAPATVT
jgi:hypothetical protein